MRSDYYLRKLLATSVHTSDIIIIGGGVIGLSTARVLALRGYKVTLLERDQPGYGASWSSGGIISPLRPWTAHTVVDRLAATSQAMYGDFIRDIERCSGMDTEYRNTGMLIVGERHVKKATAWAKPSRVACDVLEISQIKKQIPTIGRVQAGVWFPQICQVRPPRLLQTLVQSVNNVGVEIFAQTAVIEVKVEGGRVGDVITSNGKFCAPTVINAAGAWSGAVQGLSELKLGVTPVKGQMIWYQSEPVKPLRPIIDDGDHYIITREDGVIIVGSTVENCGFDLTSTSNALKKLENKARALLPQLARLEVQGQWAGLRPGRAHGIPLIGRHPSVQGLYLNTGHHRNGITLAPASAELSANLVDGLESVGVGVGTL